MTNQDIGWLRIHRTVRIRILEKLTRNRKLLFSGFLKNKYSKLENLPILSLDLQKEIWRCGMDEVKYIEQSRSPIEQSILIKMECCAEFLTRMIEKYGREVLE